MPSLRVNHDARIVLVLKAATITGVGLVVLNDTVKIRVPMDPGPARGRRRRHIGNEAVGKADLLLLVEGVVMVLMVVHVVHEVGGAAEAVQFPGNDAVDDLEVVSAADAALVSVVVMMMVGVRVFSMT